jgi:predicted adenylyl cyclase CyaB
MATEIELKAHVQDSETIKSLLHEKAEYSCAFEKHDTYWICSRSLNVPISKLRVRSDKRVFPDGSETSAIIATYKIKHMHDDMEVNDELEFTVNPGTEFERFLEAFAFTPEIRKVKRGWAFLHDGITAELAEVDGLGWFVELEILCAAVGGTSEKTVSAAREKLLALLDELGIDRKAIESRYYSAMLTTGRSGLLSGRAQGWQNARGSGC